MKSGKSEKTHNKRMQSELRPAADASVIIFQMNNKLDVLGFVLVGFTILFCGWGFYSIFVNGDENLAGKIGFAAFWLILSFMFITYSIGIGKGEEKTKIKVPKNPAIGVFSIAGVMLAIAIFINGGL